ncbi:MAG: alpha/beta hydrolase [Phaeodactylibacter sp.]|nr:alpha/beta hydrolase [Phaeodactylibacter sp.]
MAEFNYQGHQVVYEQTGEGPDLVLVHGFCEDRRMWADFQQPFTQQYRVLTFDLPGFGESSIAGKLSIQNFAELLKALLDELKITSCVLLGHSMGGYIGVAFAELYPDMLSGLGFFHSHVYADTEEKKSALSKSVEFVERNGSVPYVGQVIPSLFAEAFAQANPDLIADLVTEAHAYPAAGVINALEAMRDRPDRSAVLKELDIPVLFILGKEDQAIPYEASITQTVLPQIAQVELMEHVGHMGMFEALKQTQTQWWNFLHLVALNRN